MLIYILALVLFGMLIGSLIELKRLNELHHGYYGIIIVACAFFAHAPFWVPVIGTILIFDDAFQHMYEAFGFRQRMDDFTPIHRLGAWIMQDWKNAGWIAPLGIAFLLAVAAIFCAIHFGV